jgi:hypothetical protein
MARSQPSPKFQFQVVMEAPNGERAPGQIVEQYGVPAASVVLHKKSLPGSKREYLDENNKLQQYNPQARGAVLALGQDMSRNRTSKELFKPERISTDWKVAFACRARGE